SLVRSTLGPFETMRGKRTLVRRGRLPSTRELFAPARMSSRTERPCATACSFNLRYKEVGISTVVRTASCFTLLLSHICHKYGMEECPDLFRAQRNPPCNPIPQIILIVYRRDSGNSRYRNHVGPLTG